VVYYTHIYSVITPLWPTTSPNQYPREHDGKRKKNAKNLIQIPSQLRKRTKVRRWNSQMIYNGCIMVSQKNQRQLNN